MAVSKEEINKLYETLSEEDKAECIKAINNLKAKANGTDFSDSLADLQYNIDQYLQFEKIAKSHNNENKALMWHNTALENVAQYYILSNL